MDIKRKAIIIANPGKEGEENYCAGVFKDVENYRSLMCSPMGGLWYESEIIVLEKPKISELETALKCLKGADYSQIVFTGHGYYSRNERTTKLCLSEKDEIPLLKIRNQCMKESIILDCCRKVEENLLEKALMEDFNEKRASYRSIKNYREIFDNSILSSAIGSVVLYSCDIDETSGDDSRKGGYYSSSLLESALQWCEGQSRNYIEANELSIVEAHIMAEKRTKIFTNGRQNPQIEKPRSGKYYPFAISL